MTTLKCPHGARWTTCPRNHYPINVEREVSAMTKCKRCGAAMNPVAVMLGEVCGRCVRELHRKATR